MRVDGGVLRLAVVRHGLVVDLDAAVVRVALVGDERVVREAVGRHLRVVQVAVVGAGTDSHATLAIDRHLVAVLGQLELAGDVGRLLRVAGRRVLVRARDGELDVAHVEDVVERVREGQRGLVLAQLLREVVVGRLPDLDDVVLGRRGRAGLLAGDGGGQSAGVMAHQR